MLRQTLILLILLTGFSYAIVVELPTDIRTKSVSGNTITVDDAYAQIYPNYTLHYYILKLQNANVNVNIDTRNFEKILSKGDIREPKLYPITSERIDERVINVREEWNDEHTEVNRTEIKRNYTIYTGGAATNVLSTGIARSYIIEFKTEQWASGHYNLTAGALKFDPDVSACGALVSNNTLYTLNASIPSPGGYPYCFEVTGENVTLDCNNGTTVNTITGANYSNSYAIYSTKYNTSVRNCIIYNYQNGIYLNGADDGIISNIVMSANVNNNEIIHFNNSDNNFITNLTYYSAYPVAPTISLDYGSADNIIENSTLICNGSTIHLNEAGANNILRNTYFTGFAGIYAHTQNEVFIATNNTIITNNYYGYGIRLFKTNNSIFANNTINTIGNSIMLSTSLGNNVDNTFINNTLTSSAGNLVEIQSGAYHNIFYWNNFTDASGLYVNDTNGSNYYNYSGNGTNMGNMFHNTIDGSARFTGTVTSPWSGLNYSSGGTDYPYNNSTSDGKFSCNFEGCADYAALFGPENSCTYSGSGDWTINGWDNCVIDQSYNVTGRVIFNGDGTVQFYNPSLTKILIYAHTRLTTNVRNLLIRFRTKTIWLGTFIPG